MKEIEIIRSQRKTVAIEIKQDLRVILRVPQRMKRREIQQLIQEKTPWIEKHLAMAEARLRHLQATREPPLTENELAELRRRAKELLPCRVKALAEAVGVTYERISIRCQSTRWGSCSAKGNLNFNCLLMLCPKEVTDYVIIHELCHRKHMNHSKAFWKAVEEYCPDYQVQKQWLRENGRALIERTGNDRSSSGSHLERR